LQADLICVGNEILTGLIENSNSGFLARRLWSAGIEVRESVVAADEAHAIQAALNRALEHSEIIIFTGGLGPTDDDLTRDAVASALGLQLVLDRDWLEKIEQFFKQRGLKMPENNSKQAMVMEGATLLENRAGTAPGSIVTWNGKLVILLPGPPSELKPMFDEAVAPVLKEYNRGNLSRLKTLKCCGIGESTLEDKIKSLGNWELPPISYVARGYEVHLQLKGRGSAEEAAAAIEKAEKRLQKLLGDHIYGSDDDTLAGKVAELLSEKNLTLSLAESCSGGLLSSLLTDIPGSSNFYLGGMVAYSGEVKIDSLGLKRSLLEQEGQVSEPVAAAMARGSRAKFKSDLAVGITGIAGPEGGTAQKPVGLVYIAIDNGQDCYCKKLNLGGGRLAVKERTAQVALDMIRRDVLGSARL